MEERIVVVANDLMDRSRISGALGVVTFCLATEIPLDATTVIIDTKLSAQDVVVAKDRVPSARVICFGPHVNHKIAEDARQLGADLVLTRSVFFSNPKAVVFQTKG